MNMDRKRREPPCVGQDALEDEDLVGALGAPLLGEEDLRHAPGAEPPHDLELGDLAGRAGCRRGRGLGHRERMWAVGQPPLGSLPVGCHGRPLPSFDRPPPRAGRSRRRRCSTCSSTSSTASSRAPSELVTPDKRRRRRSASLAGEPAKVRTNAPIRVPGDRAHRARVPHRASEQRLARRSASGQGRGSRPPRRRSFSRRGSSIAGSCETGLQRADRPQAARRRRDAARDRVRVLRRLRRAAGLGGRARSGRSIPCPCSAGVLSASPPLRPRRGRAREDGGSARAPPGAKRGLWVASPWTRGAATVVELLRARPAAQSRSWRDGASSTSRPRSSRRTCCS